jgi:trigger factor
MNYELKIEDVSAIRRRLHFTVSADRVTGEVDRAFRDLKGRVRLPGFRPGKVPRNLLEARFGQQIRGEVAGRLMEDSYREAISDLDVAGRPEVEESVEVEKGQAFTFTIGVDIRPEITVKKHKGIEVEYVAAKVTPADIDRAINQRLASQARIEEVTEDRKVKEGDFVLTELKITDGDEEIVNEAGTLVNTAGERYYPGIEAMLIGMKKGKSKKGDVTIGDESVLEHLQGKSGKAELKVLGIQEHVVPSLDDEAAKTMGFDSAKEMKAKTKEQMTEQADGMAKNQARVSVLQKLVELNDFDVPQGMVEEQLQALVDEVKQRRSMMGQDPKQLRFTDTEMADLQERANFAARASCILDGVARQEKITVDEADLDARVEEISGMRGQAPEAIRAMLESQGAMSMLEARIQEEKTLDWLLDNAKLKAVDALTEKAAPKKAAAKKAAPKKAAPKKAAAKKAAPKKAASAAPAWNDKMKKGELADIAKGMGLAVTSKMTKTDIVELLTGA